MRRRATSPPPRLPPEALRRGLHQRSGFDNLLGRSARMREVFAVLERIAGRVAGIVPALKRRHDDGVVQLGQRAAVRATIPQSHRIRVRPPAGCLRGCSACLAEICQSLGPFA